jgi:hypothetical protein
MAAAAADRAPDPEAREAAALVVGQEAADDGRLEEAEGAFRGVLDRRRGSGHRLERWACLSLSKLYAHQRRGFEALVMARLGAALARKSENAWDLAVARARICAALQVLGDAERLAAAVEELDRALGGVPADRARPLRFFVHGARVEAALEAGDLETARRRLEDLKALAATGPVGDPRLPPYLEALVESRAGRPREALAHLAKARALPAMVATSRLPLSVLQARCLAETGEAAEARRVLGEVLELLEEGAEKDPIGTGQRIRWSVEAGRLLQDACGDPEGARRAFDLAAGWAMRRIAELDRTIAAVPELGGVAAEDLKALTDHRTRFVRDQGEILDRVAALFGDGEPPAGLVHAEAEDGEGFFHACAWCRRVRSSGGRWLPVGEFVPDDRDLRISHGICRDCHQRFLDRMRA